MSEAKILIVEDERLVAKSISKKLRDFGYEVPTPVSTGMEAVDAVRETMPDLVLMDVELEGRMDGVEAASLIQNELDIPVVYLTAYADEPLLQRVKITTPFGYILKPFQDEILRNTIEIALYNHQRDRKLRESEERYRVISDLVSDFAFSFKVGSGTDIELEWMTESFRRITGYETGEVNRSNWKTLIHPEDRGTAFRHLETVTSGSVDEIELRVVSKNGKTHWLNVSTQPVWNKTGDTVERIFGAARDITERKETENELKKSNSRLELLNSISTRIVTGMPVEKVIDIAVEQIAKHFSGLRAAYSTIDKHGKMNIVRSFQPHCMPDLTGLKADLTAAPQYLASLRTGPLIVNDVSKSSIMEPLAKEMAAGKTGAVLDMPVGRFDELAGLLCLDDRNPRKWTRHEIDTLEQAAGYLFISIKDAMIQTEMKRTEKELRKARESADAANQAKSAFLANMSHELRTPLNVILGYTQILQKDTETSEFQMDRLRAIRDSGEHLLTLLNDILDLSKIEAGRMEIRSEEFDLENFLKAIADNFKINAKQKNLRFRHEFGDFPETVRGDEVRLRQILMNLLGNAVKYTDKGSVALTARHDRDRLYFEVKDTGHGIAREDLEKVFSPFQQAAQGMKKAEGVGLGLAICKRLVEIMGGILKVESNPGKGSVFSVEIDLPAVAGKKKIKTLKTNVTGYKGRKRKALVVDDNPFNRAILRELLSRIGFEDFEASGGPDAVEKAKKLLPDLIMMDLVMPEMDGYETTRRIRKSDVPKETVIIAVSASAFEEDRLESLEAGCNAFVSKPVDAEKMLAALQNHMDLEWTDTNGNSQETYSEEIIRPPKEEIETLIRAVSIGDIYLIRELAEKNARQKNRYEPFWKKMDRLSKKFQLREMREMLSNANGQDS